MHSTPCGGRGAWRNAYDDGVYYRQCREPPPSFFPGQQWQWRSELPSSRASCGTHTQDEQTQWHRQRTSRWNPDPAWETQPTTQRFGCEIWFIGSNPNENNRHSRESRFQDSRMSISTTHSSTRMWMYCTVTSRTWWSHSMNKHLRLQNWDNKSRLYLKRSLKRRKAWTSPTRSWTSIIANCRYCPRTPDWIVVEQTLEGTLQRHLTDLAAKCRNWRGCTYPRNLKQLNTFQLDESLRKSCAWGLNRTKKPIEIPQEIRSNYARDPGWIQRKPQIDLQRMEHSLVKATKQRLKRNQEQDPQDKEDHGSSIKTTWKISSSRYPSLKNRDNPTRHCWRQELTEIPEHSSTRTYSKEDRDHLTLDLHTWNSYDRSDHSIVRKNHWPDDADTTGRDLEDLIYLDSEDEEVINMPPRSKAVREQTDSKPSQEINRERLNIRQSRPEFLEETVFAEWKEHCRLNSFRDRSESYHRGLNHKESEKLSPKRNFYTVNVVNNSQIFPNISWMRDSKKAQTTWSTSQLLSTTPSRNAEARMETHQEIRKRDQTLRARRFFLQIIDQTDDVRQRHQSTTSITASSEKGWSSYPWWRL